MDSINELPRLLIIDDLFGRTHENRRNEERANLCGQLLIEDVTGDESHLGRAAPRIKTPVAQAVFLRGQNPARSHIGDTVENDLEGTMQFIQTGWDHAAVNGQPRWALVLLDLCFYTGAVTHESDRKAMGMPEGREADDDPNQYFGLRLLKAIHERLADLPVLILSSKPRSQVSREFTQFGALGFLPRNEENSSELLREYIWRHGLIPDDAGEIVGRSKTLLLTLRAARRAASARQNILIRGERGTGKELLARYINRQVTKTKIPPLVTVDSGALSPQLFASELFGHRRGSFTGANHDRIGKIQQANGGDLFLDEIGNLPLDVQVALLRVLEYGEVTPLGANKGEAIDVRFITATNEDLENKASTGGFRSDLLDRLRVGGTIFLSPLRERPEDFDLLVEHLVRQAERAKPGALHRVVEPATLEQIRAHAWAGNIRELRSFVFSAVFNYPDVEHFQPVHLSIRRQNDTGTQAESQPDFVIPEAKSGKTDFTLDEIIAALNDFNFDNIKATELSGKLPALQQAYGVFVVRLVKVALQITGRPTLERLEGKILIHPAMKLLTGNKSITASKAADVVKRLFSLLPDNAELLYSDSVLREAYETALRLRPRQPQKKV